MQLKSPSPVHFLPLALVSLFLLASCSSADIEPVQSEPALPLSPTQESSQTPSSISYNIVTDETSDTPIKTQVELRLIVGGEITDAGLRQLLNALYTQAISRSGFTYHPRPTNVYIYAYTDQTHLEDGMAWVAMLQKSYSDTTPAVSISELQLAQLTALKEEKFGFSEKERMRIFQDYVRAEDRATREGEKRYPSDPMKAYDLKRTMQEQYKVDLASEKGITRDQLGEIVSEGLQKEWPLPKYQ